ncbi:MAG: hypothetical protein M3O70_19480 [Actinomycetota bacterium]|nr:hypothetical protein [Actinomycetota bacterium]
MAAPHTLYYPPRQRIAFQHVVGGPDQGVQLCRDVMHRLRARNRTEVALALAQLAIQWHLTGDER